MPAQGLLIHGTQGDSDGEGSTKSPPTHPPTKPEPSLHSRCLLPAHEAGAIMGLCAVGVPLDLMG